MIQGDTLKKLVGLAQQVQHLTNTVTDKSELKELSQELVEDLSRKLREYEFVLKDNGIELPYT